MQYIAYIAVLMSVRVEIISIHKNNTPWLSAVVVKNATTIYIQFIMQTILLKFGLFVYMIVFKP